MVTPHLTLLIKKQRKKSPENNTPSPYQGRGNSSSLGHASPLQKISSKCVDNFYRYFATHVRAHTDRYDYLLSGGKKCMITLTKKHCAYIQRMLMIYVVIHMMKGFGIRMTR